MLVEAVALRFKTTIKESVVSLYPEYQSEMNRVIAETQQKLYLPIDFAIRNGTFLTRWKQKNPWTDENFPAIEQELKQGLLAGAGSKTTKY